MKKILFIALAIVGAFGIIAFRSKDPGGLRIGAGAPGTDLKMRNIDNRMISLGDVVGRNGLLVVFSCNTCPFVIGAEGYGDGWEGRYNDLNRICKNSGVGMVIVNSNDAKRDRGENIADMKSRAESRSFSEIPYVLDAGSELANAFGARTTPHVFLFDDDLKLVYKGAIDDSNESPSKVKEPWLTNALNNLSAGLSIDPSETKPVGCSIKRVQ